MKIAYFDCQSGISGNMILGALLNAGFPLSYLKTELKKLLVSRYSLLVTNKKTSTYFNVKTKEEKHPRCLKDIIRIIKQSKLSSKIKKKSIQIFENLAEAESIVHGIPINKVHFHEIGAVDAIIDIVGAVIGLEYLGIEEIYSSPINTGSGKVKTTHGLLPVPAPATLEILKGVPIYDSGIKKELTTPTGASIIKTLAKGFGPLPRIKVSTIGIGAGSHDLLEQPNILRVIIGEKEIQAEHDAILQIEANIDDMNPKFYDRAITNIMKAGALDAYITPIRMKKQRNAVQLVALCKPEDKEKVLDSIFTETTSFGIRVFLVEREKLKKQIVKTKYGRIKFGKLGEKIKTMAIEPDDYIRLKNKVPVRKITTPLLSRCRPF
jgi:hypothetical protein